MSHRIQLRRDKAAFWAQEDPILAQGELAWSTDTGELKIGDGVTAWSELSNILGGTEETGGSTNIPIYDTAENLWDDPEFGNFENGQLFLIRDFSTQQQDAGGALLRMVNDGIQEPDTETVLIGIASTEGQFRATTWLYEDPANLPEYTLAASASMTAALDPGEIFFEDNAGQIRIYFPSDTLDERNIGIYSKSQELLIALNDMSKAAIVRIGGVDTSGGTKNYRMVISTNEGSVIPIDAETPLLDIQDILNGVHDLDTFIVGNAALISSTAEFQQENRAELSVNATLQPNSSSLTVTDPGTGKIGFDSLSMNEVTRLVISKTAENFQEVLDFIIDQDPQPDYGERLLVIDLPDQNKEGYVFRLGNNFSDEGDFVEIKAEYITSNDGEIPGTFAADESVEIYLVHSPYKAEVDLSQFVTEAQVMEMIAPFTQNPISIGTPMGVQSEITHSGTGYETIAQLGFIREEFVAAVNFGAQMVLEINLNYYVKPNGTQPLVRLKLGNIEVKLPSGNIPGVDSFLYFEGTVTLFIHKPASDLTIKALTRFRSYETFAGGDLQDDLVHFPGDYLGNDDYTVTGNWAVDGSFTETNPTLQFDADSGIKARLEKASGQVSLAM
ncbi:hypothetical protein [uncultured Algoriphagus sp.]|uniref:hyaluronate lyase N-terminal domain-containing protein n=1 Tax=uncultured Algoriphagus sp. TaxID=417365 RepID=UPI00258D0526|nr:hypothetical protein [uncultured Algoriphagus sp.]